MSATHEPLPAAGDRDACEHARSAPPTAAENERRMRVVVAVTAATMVLELVAGVVSGSMALTMDGVHMATHVGALGLAAFAYWFARTRARDSAFTFGTGKVNALAGFSSALLLFAAAGWMALESIDRVLTPTKIDYLEALPVAIVGLLVNLVSAKLLHASPTHDHAHADHDTHGHAHDHAHRHDHTRDHNWEAAYVHVVADALTSLLAIVALALGHWLGWAVLDPVMGVVGSLVVLRWAIGLMGSSARVLVDATIAPEVPRRIRETLEGLPGVRVVDLHLWEAAPGERFCMVTVEVGAEAAAKDLDAASLRARLKGVCRLDHLTIELRAR